MESCSGSGSRARSAPVSSDRPEHRQLPSLAATPCPRLPYSCRGSDLELLEGSQLLIPRSAAPSTASLIRHGSQRSPPEVDGGMEEGDEEEARTNIGGPRPKPKTKPSLLNPFSSSNSTCVMNPEPWLSREGSALSKCISAQPLQDFMYLVGAGQ